MEESHDNLSEAQSRFWDRYIDYFSKQGVKTPARRWYFRHVENYLEVYKHKKLAIHTPEDVTNYSQKLGRQDRIEDWQFRQPVNATWKLFSFLDVQMKHRVDWQYWLDSSSALPPDHRSIAREAPVSGKSDQLVTTEKGYMQGLRRRYADVRRALISEIRRRAYAISTKQTMNTGCLILSPFTRGLIRARWVVKRWPGFQSTLLLIEMLLRAHRIWH